MSKYNRIIHGKNSTENVVSCEVTDDFMEIFYEENGVIKSEFKPNKFWLLAPIQLDKNFQRLEGNLYYRYIKFYTNHDDFIQDRKKYWRSDTYFINDKKEAAMVGFGFTYFKGMRVSDVSVLAFDIESTGLEYNNDSKVVLIANTYRSQGKITRKMFCHDEYETEAEMFDAWCNWVREINPSIMLGHNIYGYDFGYMDFCARKAGTSLKLGRDGSDIYFNPFESEYRVDGANSYKYKRAFIYGREIIDTFFIAHKYDIVTKKYSNYRLKTIIKEEGLEIEGRQFYDAGNIKDNYLIPEEMEKIKAYAEQDGDDALALYDLMIPSFFYLNSYIPKSFQQIGYTATGSQLNAFLVRSYLQDLHSIPKGNQAEKFEGAISAGQPGFYKNVFKVDVASLYPSIMITYDVYDKYKDPNAHFSQMVKYFTKQRLENKKLAKETGDRYYKDLEQSEKIVINSAYGLLGSVGLQFNSPRNAAFVTAKGREILETAINWCTGKKYGE